MRDLIEALTILAKYMPDASYSPTHCEHDVMYVMVSPDDVTEEDKRKLEKLGFDPDDEYQECFRSFRFGSA